MTPEEFERDAREALGRANDTGERIMSNLDGWLIGAASALLSLPMLLRGELSLLGAGAWWVFAVSAALLAFSLAGVLGRNALMWFRIQYAATTVGEMRNALTDGRMGEAVFEAWVKKRRDTANNLRSWEIWAFVATLALFVAGAILYGVVAVLRTWPGNVRPH